MFLCAIFSSIGVVVIITRELVFFSFAAVVESRSCFFVQELCRQAKIEYAEETRKAQELHDKIAADRANEKYNKHYNSCMQVSLRFQSMKIRFAFFLNETPKHAAKADECETCRPIGQALSRVL